MNYQQFHAFQVLSAKWETAKENRPSTFRNQFIFILINIIFSLVILGSIVLYSTTFFKEMWLPLFEGEISAEQIELITRFFIIVKGILLFFIIISSIITWLSSRAMRRNEYINSLEEIIEEYKDSINTSIASPANQPE